MGGGQNNPALQPKQLEQVLSKLEISEAMALNIDKTGFIYLEQRPDGTWKLVCTKNALNTRFPEKKLLGKSLKLVVGE